MFLNFLKEKHFVHQRLVNLKKKYDYSKNNSQLQENQTNPSFTILSLARIPEGWGKTISLLKLHLTKRSRQLIFITNVIFIYLSVSRDVFLSDINWLFFCSLLQVQCRFVIDVTKTMLRDIPEGFEVLLRVRTIRVFYLNSSWKPRKSSENLPTIPAINLKAELSENFSVVDNLYAVAK